MSTRIPGGNSATRFGSSARTALDNTNGLAVDCLITPSATAGLPLKRTTERSFCAATSTLPMSPMRTGKPLTFLTTTAANSEAWLRSV